MPKNKNTQASTLLNPTYNSFASQTGNIFLYCLLALVFLPTIVAPLFTVYGYSPDLHMAWMIQQGSTFLLAWFFLSHLNKQRFGLALSPLMYTLLGFYSWALLSIFWAHNTFESIISLLDWGAGVLIFLIVLNNVRNAEKIRLLVIAAWSTALLLSILGCMQWLFDVELVQQHAKPAATFNNKNMAAQYCLMSIALGMGLLWSSKTLKETWFFAIGTSIIALFVHYTNTRGASFSTIGIFLVMGALLFIDIFLLKRKGPMGKAKWSAGATAIVIFFVLGMFTSEDFIGLKAYTGQVTRINSIVTAELNKDTLQRGHRLDIWSNTLGIIEDHPLIGVGAGNWMVFYPKYQTSKAIDREMSEAIQHINAHNDYLEIFADLGLIGMLLLLSVFGSAAFLSLRNFYQNTDNPNRYVLLGVLLAATGIAINAIGSFPMKQPAPIMLICIYLAIIAAENARWKNTKILTLKVKPIGIIGAAIGLLATSSVFALHYQWNQSEIFFRLATISSHRQNYHDMMRYGKLSHDHLPLRDRMFNFVGIGHLRTGNPSEAAKYLELVKKSYPYRNNTLQNLGYIYLELADRDRKNKNTVSYINNLLNAVKNLSKLVEIRKDNARAMSNLGIAYYRLAAAQTPNESLETIKKAITWLNKSYEIASNKSAFTRVRNLAMQLQVQLQNYKITKQAPAKIEITPTKK